MDGKRAEGAMHVGLLAGIAAQKRRKAMRLQREHAELVREIAVIEEEIAKEQAGGAA